MNKQKQRKAMARMDGLDILDGIAYRHDSNGYPIWIGDVPDYFDPIEGHGHIQRVINGLSDKGINCQSEYDRYLDCLRSIVGGYYYMQKATCEQKVEAILKAKGLWEVEV